MIGLKLTRVKHAAHFLLIFAVFLALSGDLYAVLKWGGWKGRPLNGNSGAASTLNENIVAYWNMDEESGTRVDAVGTGCGGSGCDLTDNNTVTFDTGITNNAAEFEASNTESLTHSDDASLSIGGIDWTIAVWARADTLSVIRQRIVCKGFSPVEYDIYYHNTSDRFRCESGGLSVDGTNGGSPSTGTWYHIVCRYDESEGKLSIVINDNAEDTDTSGTKPTDTTDAFRVGASCGGSSTWDGDIDSFYFSKDYMTDDEIIERYGGGSGNGDYPF